MNSLEFAPDELPYRGLFGYRRDGAKRPPRARHRSPRDYSGIERRGPVSFDQCTFVGGFESLVMKGKANLTAFEVTSSTGVGLPNCQ